MREKFVVGNWKMYTTSAAAGRLAKAIVDGMRVEDRVSVAVCPPFPYLALVGEILKGSRVALGAQNLYPEKEGAFTGEVSLFCCGETLDEREAGQTEAVLDRQLILGLAGLSADTLIRLTIAYEPVWAIGNAGHEATPQQAHETHAVIRRRFGLMFDEKSAQALVIQYGGSVKPDNAAALLGQPGVDGALIGGASLHAEQFLAIVRAGISEPQTEGKW